MADPIYPDGWEPEPITPDLVGKWLRDSEGDDDRLKHLGEALMVGRSHHISRAYLDLHAKLERLRIRYGVGSTAELVLMAVNANLI